MAQKFKFKSPGFTGRKLILSGTFTMLMGAYLVWRGVEGSRMIIDLLMTYFFIVGVFNFVVRWLKPKEDRTSIVGNVIQIISAVWLSYLNYATNVPVHFIVVLLGAYQLFMGVINGITYYLYRKDKIAGRGRYLWDAILYSMFGISALTDWGADARLQYLILGIYLIFLGFTYLRDGLFFESDAAMSNLKRHGRVSLPIVLVALIPHKTLRSINDYLHGDEALGETAADIYNQAKVTETPDLEVFIHVTESGFGAMGHVDICYNQQVISYGSYDTFSEKLGGAIGEGVLFEVDREKYIEFCKRESQKTLFGYGLKLSDAQREAVEARIAEIKSEVYEWQPDNRPIKQEAQAKPMYSYRLQQETNAKLYKFNTGKFKSYFVLSTNCVLLADSIIGQAGTDVLSVKGIISPGTYHDYLERQFAKPHSIVVTKSVY